MYFHLLCKRTLRDPAMRRSGKTLNLLKYRDRILCIVSILACLTTLAGCAASGQRIHTEPLRETGSSGTFTLILYGGNYSDDLETVAFLDREGDDSSFDIYAPEFNYRLVRGLALDEGLKKAEEFVSRQSSFHQIRWSSIVDDQSGIIGYEVRPLYLPFTYGTEDLLDVSYAAKGNKVIVTIRLKPSVENKKMRGRGIQVP